MHKLCRFNHRYTIMNKLLTNKKSVDNPGFVCYNIDKKRGKEDKTMSNSEYVAWMEDKARKMNLEELKEAEFLNNMADHWQWDERVWATILSREIRWRTNN